MVDLFDLSVRVAHVCRYGLSTGTPSEMGLKLDAEAALMYLHSREDLDSKKIVWPDCRAGLVNWIGLDCIALHCIALHWIGLHWIALDRISESIAFVRFGY